jgi:hypothetical protein
VDEAPSFEELLEAIDEAERRADKSKQSERT